MNELQIGQILPVPGGKITVISRAIPNDGRTFVVEFTPSAEVVDSPEDDIEQARRFL